MSSYVRRCPPTPRKGKRKRTDVTFIRRKGDQWHKVPKRSERGNYRRLRELLFQEDGSPTPFLTHAPDVLNFPFEINEEGSVVKTRDRGLALVELSDADLARLHEGLAYLHEEAKFVHGDVFARNVVRDPNTHLVYLIDFGNCCPIGTRVPPSHTAYIGPHLDYVIMALEHEDYRALRKMQHKLVNRY